MVNVPTKYQTYVDDAAKATGLPVDVVAAQINLESSWNPNAVSPAGAEGIAQFEPGTFKSYGPPGGSPFNVSDAFFAYTAYMKDLLKQEGGSVRKALEAYNAGPGNLKAGAGYADEILTIAAVSGDVKAVGAGVAAGSAAAKDASGGGLLSFPKDIVDFFTNGTDFVTEFISVFKAFFQPSTYIRIGAGFFGFFALFVALFLLYKETRNS